MPAARGIALQVQLQSIDRELVNHNAPVQQRAGVEPEPQLPPLREWRRAESRGIGDGPVIAGDGDVPADIPVQVAAQEHLATQ